METKDTDDDMFEFDRRGLTHGSRKVVNNTVAIGSFGTLSKMYFYHGGFAQVLIDRPEFCCMLDAWELLEKDGKADPDVLSALNVLRKKFHQNARADWRILASTVIGGFGVNLEALHLVHEDGELKDPLL